MECRIYHFDGCVELQFWRGRESKVYQISHDEYNALCKSMVENFNFAQQLKECNAKIGAASV